MGSSFQPHTTLVCRPRIVTLRLDLLLSRPSWCIRRPIMPTRRVPDWPRLRRPALGPARGIGVIVALWGKGLRDSRRESLWRAKSPGQAALGGIADAKSRGADRSTPPFHVDQKFVRRNHAGCAVPATTIPYIGSKSQCMEVCCGTQASNRKTGTNLPHHRAASRRTPCTDSPAPGGASFPNHASIADARRTRIPAVGGRKGRFVAVWRKQPMNHPVCCRI